MAKARLCAKCGSAAVKLYPQDFPSATKPLPPLFSTKVPPSWAGIPDADRPILVCTSCGHNEDLRQRLP